MRKIIQALAAAALLISVAGCSSVNSEKTTALSLMEEINNKMSILLIQMPGSGMRSIQNILWIPMGMAKVI